MIFIHNYYYYKYHNWPTLTFYPNTETENIKTKEQCETTSIQSSSNNFVNLHLKTVNNKMQKLRKYLMQQHPGNVTFHCAETSIIWKGRRKILFKALTSPFVCFRIFKSCSVKCDASFEKLKSLVTDGSKPSADKFNLWRC